MPIGMVRKDRGPDDVVGESGPEHTVREQRLEVAEPDEDRRGNTVPAEECQRHGEQRRDEDDDDIDEQCRDQIQPVHRTLRWISARLPPSGTRPPDRRRWEDTQRSISRVMTGHGSRAKR